MISCKNCFLKINNIRKETRCATCNAMLHKDCAIKDGGTFLCDVCFTVKEEGSVSLQTTNFEMPSIIRRSYIELYKSCPYAFYLSVIKKENTISSSFAQIGIDLHELFHLASTREIKNIEDMMVVFKNCWNQYQDSLFEQDLNLYKNMSINDLRNKLYNQSLKAIEQFFNILKTLPKQPFCLEKNIKFCIGEELPKVSITMDRIDEINEELHIIDWKTGTVMVGRKISSDLQAPLYIKAVQTFYKKPIKNFTFHYLVENKKRVFERVDDENYMCCVNKREYFINLTDSIREVQHIFSQIKNGNFNIPKNAKKMYFTCKTCHFNRCNMCSGADIESWTQYNKK